MSHRNLDMVKIDTNTYTEDSLIASITASIDQINTEYTSLIALTKLNTKYINSYITQLSDLDNTSIIDNPPPDLNNLDIPEELLLSLNVVISIPVESVIEHKDRIRRSIVNCKNIITTSLIRISSLSANRKSLCAKLYIVKSYKKNIVDSAISVCLSGEEIYQQYVIDELAISNEEIYQHHGIDDIDELGIYNKEIYQQYTSSLFPLY
jgi:hypothetical protein